MTRRIHEAERFNELTECLSDEILARPGVRLKVTPLPPRVDKVRFEGTFVSPSRHVT